jgi:LPS sulfotransferase NodH
LRDKMRRLEAALAEKGISPLDAAPEAIDADRKEFVAALMEPLLGRQKSNGL